MANGTTDYSLGMLATKPNCSSYFCLTPNISLGLYDNALNFDQLLAYQGL